MRIPARAYACLRGVSLALALVLGACGGPSGAAPSRPPPQVGVVEVRPQPFELSVRLPGRVSAFEVSEVRPQIGGIVRTRRFVEGSSVKAGQVLYEIDPGPARAALAQSEALAASTRARFERYQQLIDIGAVSRQEFDDARAAADQAAAALDNAKINLNYTRVTAPITGIIGASSVTPGALATPGQAQPFALIQQIDKVYVDVTQSSADLLRLRRAIAANQKDKASAIVRLELEDGSLYPQTGALQFSDVTVNEQTGTVTLRALFPNKDHLLLPGMFVQAQVSQGIDPDAILAPQQAVTRNAKGEAVALVLNKDGVVEQRTLQTGAAAGDHWVVTGGLASGDRLIVEGVQHVAPGDRATPVAWRPAKPPAGKDG